MMQKTNLGLPYSTKADRQDNGNIYDEFRKYSCYRIFCRVDGRITASTEST